MGGIDRDAIAKALGVDPSTHDIVVTMAIGRASGLEGLSDEIVERELAVRERKPLAEILWNPLG
jgi:hypothetical protein